MTCVVCGGENPTVVKLGNNVFLYTELSDFLVYRTDTFAVTIQGFYFSKPLPADEAITFKPVFDT